MNRLHDRFPRAGFLDRRDEFTRTRTRPGPQSIINEFMKAVECRSKSVKIHFDDLEALPSTDLVDPRIVNELRPKYRTAQHRNSLRAVFLSYDLLNRVISNAVLANPMRYNIPILSDSRAKIVTALNRGSRRLRRARRYRRRAAILPRFPANEDFIYGRLIKWLRAGRHRRRLSLSVEASVERIAQLLRKFHLSMPRAARLAAAHRAFFAAPIADIQLAAPAAAVVAAAVAVDAAAPDADYVGLGGGFDDDDHGPLGAPQAVQQPLPAGPSLSLATVNIHNAHDNLPATIMALQNDLKVHFREHQRGADLIAVQETHAKPTVRIGAVPGYNMFQQPRITDSKNPSGGLAVLVRTHLIARPMPLLSRTSTSVGMSEWLAVRVSAEPRSIIVFSLYRAPTDRSEQSTALFKSHLATALASGDAIAVAGDLNIDFAVHRPREHSLRLQWLDALAPLVRLPLVGGHAATTVNGTSEIDYIFLFNCDPNQPPPLGHLVASAGSDHKTIATILPTFKPTSLTAAELGRINWRLLSEQPDLLSHIMGPVRARLDCVGEPTTVSALCSLITENAAGVLGLVKGRLARPKSDEWKSSPWWTGELEHLRAQLIRLRRRIDELQTRDRERSLAERNWLEAHRLERQAERTNQIHTKQVQLKLCASELQAAKLKSKANYYRNIRYELNPNCPADISAAHHILDSFTNRKQDPISHSNDTMYATWTEIMAPNVPREVYDPRTDADAADARLAQLIRQQDEATPISHRQVLAAVSKLPANRAPGPDGIPNTVWRSLFAGDNDDDLLNGPTCDPLVHWFAMYASSLLLNKDAPIEPCLQTANVALIAKTSNPKPTDYRPISLLNTVAKFIEHIYFTRWRPRLGGPLLARQLHNNDTTSQLTPLEQSGFCPKRNTLQELLLLRLARERAVRDGRSLHLLLLDQQKAFDSVQWASLIRSMAVSGRWHHTEIHLAQRWISNQTRRLMLPDGPSPLIYTTRGTPQGGVLSPVLYNMHVNGLLAALDALAELPAAQRPVERAVINDSLSVSALLYADDTTPLGYSMETMQRQAAAALSWATSTGSTFNETKCSFIVLDPSGRVPDLQFSPTTTIKPDSSTRLLGVITDSLNPNVMQPCPKAAIKLKLKRQPDIFGPSAGANPKLSVGVMRAATETPIVHAAAVATVDESFLDKSSAAICRIALGVYRSWNAERVKAFCGWPSAAATVLKLSLSLIRNAPHLKEVFLIELQRPLDAHDSTSWRNLIASRLISMHPALAAHRLAPATPAALTAAFGLLHRGLNGPGKRDWHEIIVEPVADALWPSPHKAFKYAGHNAVAVFRFCEKTFSQSWVIKTYFHDQVPQCPLCAIGPFMPEHAINACAHFADLVNQITPNNHFYNTTQHLIDPMEYSSAVTAAVRDPKKMPIDLNLIREITATLNNRREIDKANEVFTRAVACEASAVIRQMWNEIKPLMQQLETDARARRRDAAAAVDELREVVGNLLPPSCTDITAAYSRLRVQRSSGTETMLLDASSRARPTFVQVRVAGADKMMFELTKIVRVRAKAPNDPRFALHALVGTEFAVLPDDGHAAPRPLRSLGVHRAITFESVMEIELQYVCRHLNDTTIWFKTLHRRKKSFFYGHVMGNVDRPPHVVACETNVGSCGVHVCEPAT
jgi:hypothetical protein